MSFLSFFPTIYIIFPTIYIYISQRLDKKSCMVPSILQFQFKTNIKESQDMRKNVVYLKLL